LVAIATNAKAKNYFRSPPKSCTMSTSKIVDSRTIDAMVMFSRPRSMRLT
jgi:hypothetical protein